MFGADLDAVVARESGMAAVTGAGGAPSASVPVLVRRCVEEVERRGLDIIGLYRLCGSATKKRILREAFERNPRTVDLSPDNVPDINVITGELFQRCFTHRRIQSKGREGMFYPTVFKRCVKK